MVNGVLRKLRENIESVTRTEIKSKKEISVYKESMIEVHTYVQNLWADFATHLSWLFRDDEYTYFVDSTNNRLERKNGILKNFIEKMPGRRVIDTINAIREFFIHEFFISSLFEAQKKERSTSERKNVEAQRNFFNLIKSLRLRPAVHNNVHKINSIIELIKNL